MKNQNTELKTALVPEAAELLAWACESFGRRPIDIINGALFDSLTQAREEYDKNEMTNEVEHIHESITKAARARQQMEDEAILNKVHAQTQPESSLLTVTLDKESSYFVNWYSRTFGRELADVVSGTIMAEIPQAKDEYERDDMSNIIRGLEDCINEVCAKRKSEAVA